MKMATANGSFVHLRPESQSDMLDRSWRPRPRKEIREMAENNLEHIFLKVKWQVITAVDRNNQYKQQLVGHCEPDIAKNGRARYVHLSMQKRLPAVWHN